MNPGLPSEVVCCLPAQPPAVSTSGLRSVWYGDIKWQRTSGHSTGTTDFYPALGWFRYPWSGGGLHLRRRHQLLPCVQRPTHSERSWLLGGLGQLQWHADQRSEDQGDGLLILQISRFGTNYHWQQSNQEDRLVQASWSHTVLGSVLECAYWLCLVQVQPAHVLIVTPEEICSTRRRPANYIQSHSQVSARVRGTSLVQLAARIPVRGAGTGTAAGAADHLWGRLIQGPPGGCRPFHPVRVPPASLQGLLRKMNKPDNKLHHLLPTPKEHKYSLRHPRRLPDIPGRMKHFRNSFVPRAVRVFDWSLMFSCMGSDYRSEGHHLTKSRTISVILSVCWPCVHF